MTLLNKLKNKIKNTLDNLTANFNDDLKANLGKKDGQIPVDKDEEDSPPSLATCIVQSKGSEVALSSSVCAQAKIIKLPSQAYPRIEHDERNASTVSFPHQSFKSFEREGGESRLVGDNKDNTVDASFDSATEIQSAEKFYSIVVEESERGRIARLAWLQRCWITSMCPFDRFTGDPEETNILERLRVIASVPASELTGRGYLHRIVQHTGKAVAIITGSMRTRIQREQVLTPVYATREIDTSGMQWLARRQGKTVREKLADRPYLMAVHRKTTYDTIENRLLKEFAERMRIFLRAREAALRTLNLTEDEFETEFRQIVRQWLASEDVEAIGPWQNISPNNVLLQDKQYRRVLDGWRFLQHIDENIIGDIINVRSVFLSILLWRTVAMLHSEGILRIPQQPTSVSYERWSLRASNSDSLDGVLILKKSGGKAYEPISFLSQADRVVVQLININQSLEATRNGNIISILANGNILKTYDILQVKPEEIATLFVDTLNNIAGEKSNRDIWEIPTNRHGINAFAFELDRFCPRMSDSENGTWSGCFNMLCQKRNIEGRQIHMDCSCARAIRIEDDTETVSGSSLFSGWLSPNIEAEATDCFVASLASMFSDGEDSFFPARTYYLLPDRMNDFSSAHIRERVQLRFKNSLPLPRSVAAVFTTKRKFRAGDYVLVAEAFATGISMTPLEASHDSDVEQIIPESYGIVWKRHPAQTVTGEQMKAPRPFFYAPKNMGKIISRLLAPSDCDRLAGKISFVQDSEWFHMPKDAGQYQKAGILGLAAVKRCLYQAFPDMQDLKNCYILFSDDKTRPKEDLEKSGIHLEYLDIPVTEGAVRMAMMESAIEEALKNNLVSKRKSIPLWTDHLPELWLYLLSEGGYKAWHQLIGGEQIMEPIFGKSATLKLDFVDFTLPKGMDEFVFPLRIGREGNNKEFNAYLKSRDFPFREDVACELTLTYTYGNKYPYELKFKPRKKQYRNFSAEWKKKDEFSMKSKDLHAPKFPKIKDWEEFYRYPKKNSNETSNLYEWFENSVQKLKDYDNFYDYRFDKYINSRKEIHIEYSGAAIGKNFYKAVIEETGEKVFFTQSDIIENIIYSDNDIVYGILVPNKKYPGEFIARDVCSKRIPTEEIKDKYINKNRQYINQQKSNFYKDAINSIKNCSFPVQTIWLGHSLSDFKAPDSFRLIVKNFIDISEQYIKDGEIGQYIIKLLCYMHKDMPEYISKWLENIIDNNEYSHYQCILFPYAVGDIQYNWQQKIANTLIDMDKKEFSEIKYIELLSIAIWRSEYFIYKIPYQKLEYIANKVYYVLEKSIEDKLKLSSWQLCRLLELAFALLRTRDGKHPDSKTKELFAYGAQLNDKYLELIEGKVTEYIVKNKIVMKPFVSLSLQKPQQFQGIPDILYALIMYLSGDDGCSSIVISEIGEE